MIENKININNFTNIIVFDVLKVFFDCENNDKNKRNNKEYHVRYSYLSEKFFKNNGKINCFRSKSIMIIQ